MSQKVKNLKQQQIYKKRRIALAVVLVLLVALIIAIYAATSNTNKVANAEVSINDGTIDISKIISTDPNPPTVRCRNDTNKMGWNILGNNNKRRCRLV